MDRLIRASALLLAVSRHERIVVEATRTFGIALVFETNIVTHHGRTLTTRQPTCKAVEVATRQVMEWTQIEEVKIGVIREVCQYEKWQNGEQDQSKHNFSIFQNFKFIFIMRYLLIF